jgi:hypothetical protein
MKSIFTIFTIFLLSACSAPPKVVSEISQFLTGNCRAIFLDDGAFRYQHLSHAIGGRAVFALSDSSVGQYCGYATNNYKDVKESAFEIQAPWDKLEVVAIARCESVKPAGAPPCKVFARNNEVVWKFIKKSTLD